MILLSAARAGTSLALASQGEHTPPVYMYTDHLRAFLFSLAAKFDATKAERIVVLQIHSELVRDDDSSRFVKTPCANGYVFAMKFSPPENYARSPLLLVIMRSADRLTL